jgi:hypothetical protein
MKEFGNMKRKLITLVVLIAVLGMAAVPALAQTTSRTFTKTEAQINESYRVTNPYWRTLSDVSVDLQPGQVVMNATYTTRTVGPLAISTTLVPSIHLGRLYWEATSVTADGQPVSPAVLDQINNSIYYSWINFWRRSGPAGHVTGIDITGDAISLTLSR